MRIAEIAQEVEDIDLSLKYVDEARNLVVTSKDQLGLLLYKVIILIENQRQNEALKILRNEDQNEEIVLVGLIAVFMSIKNWDSAEKYAKRLLEVNPQNEFVDIYLGKVYLKLGDYNKALDYYKAVKVTIDNEKAVLSELISVYLKLGKLEEAERHFEELNKKYKDHPDAFFSRAKLEFEKGNVNEAYQILKNLEPYVSNNKDEFKELLSDVRSKMTDASL